VKCEQAQRDAGRGRGVSEIMLAARVHIFTAPSQPATNFVDRTCDRPIRFRCKSRRLFRTDCCGIRRWAKYVRVQVFYDCIHCFCADGRGCKGP